MIKIDALGLSCPEPLIMLKKELEKSGEVILMVDNKISVETCSRYVKSKGYSVDIATSGSVHELHIKK